MISPQRLSSLNYPVFFTTLGQLLEHLGPSGAFCHFLLPIAHTHTPCASPPHPGSPTHAPALPSCSPPQPCHWLTCPPAIAHLLSPSPPPPAHVRGLLPSAAAPAAGSLSLSTLPLAPSPPRPPTGQPANWPAVGLPTHLPRAVCCAGLVYGNFKSAVF